MASAAGRLRFAMAAPLALGGLGFAASRYNWAVLARRFFTGPGKTSRILLLLAILFNWKNMPFAWTWRVFYSIFYHSVIRPAPQLGPPSLFAPIISVTRAPLLEIDYNFHKSNSTYFTDLDISRCQLVFYLFRPALRSLANNATTHLVRDPSTNKPMPGRMSVILGSVECSFRREIGAYKRYECWSSVVTWDRKWVYIATYFLPAGVAKPKTWLDPGHKRVRTRGEKDAGTKGAKDWDKLIYATAVSRYVFKQGRYTVHPAVLLDKSGLLPERPGGWQGGENQVGDETEELGVSAEEHDAADWDWRRVEAKRRRGIEFVKSLGALDDLHEQFSEVSEGAIGKFSSVG